MGFGSRDKNRVPPQGGDQGSEDERLRESSPDLLRQAAADAPQGLDPSPEEEIARLRQELSEKEVEAAACRDQFLRERAELENFKRRSRRDQAESLRFACEPLIRDLLPAVDNLERAVQHAAGGGNGAPLVEGVTLVLKSLEDTLRRHGVTIVDAAPGEVFDPTRHEALARVEMDGEPNRIVNQHERGAFLHDRLLRPAKVVVSCARPAADAVETPGEDD